MCKHLVLATMSCDKGREDMMVSGSWKPLIDKGATFFRLDNTAASASELAITLLAKDQSVSHTERLELRRRQAEWHAGTALTCLLVYPALFTGLFFISFCRLAAAPQRSRSFLRNGTISVRPRPYTGRHNYCVCIILSMGSHD
jgi:hypothetical protein